MADMRSKEIMMTKGGTFVDALVTDPKNVPRVRLVTGYPGKAAQEKSVRIYLDPSLSAHLDVPTADVLHSQPVETNSTLGATAFWIRADAQVRPSGGGSFLHGPIAAAHLGSVTDTVGLAKWWDLITTTPIDVTWGCPTDGPWSRATPVVKLDAERRLAATGGGSVGLYGPDQDPGTIPPHVTPVVRDAALAQHALIARANLAARAAAANAFLGGPIAQAHVNAYTPPFQPAPPYAGIRFHPSWVDACPTAPGITPFINLPREISKEIYYRGW
ncbi:MAG TPA: hypothetical protein VHH36_03765 [Candidatus Thermoplasmatota archaeon]|nr:hypothetical protein [Candidatus Thermoplasmatota archaeon]